MEENASTSSWRADARLAGTLDRSGKAYVAMLIARCVRPGHGEGNRPEVDGSKVSARKFAAAAGISPTTVTAYWRTWERLACDGHVPDPDRLRPGKDCDLPDSDVWDRYYRLAARPPRPWDDDHGDDDSDVVIPVNTADASCRTLTLEDGFRDELNKLWAAFTEIYNSNLDNEDHLIALKEMSKRLTREINRRE